MVLINKTGFLNEESITFFPEWKLNAMQNLLGSSQFFKEKKIHIFSKGVAVTLSLISTFISSFKTSQFSFYTIRKVIALTFKNTT